MFYAKAQDSLSAGERIFSLLDEPITIQDTENATDFETIKGDIEYRNIEFYYKKGNNLLRFVRKRSYNINTVSLDELALLYRCPYTKQ